MLCRLVCLEYIGVYSNPLPVAHMAFLEESYEIKETASAKWCVLQEFAQNPYIVS
jgi:hypothetical protein